MAAMTVDGPRPPPAPGKSPSALVVLLHGYGSNGADPDCAFAADPASASWRGVVAPKASSSLPDKAQAYEFWPIRSLSNDERSTGTAAAAPAVDAFLTRELERLGPAEDRLLLIGSSQGTMMALHVSLRRGRVLAGIIGYSGMLVAAER